SLLARAFVASRHAPSDVPRLLDLAADALATPLEEVERACLLARLVDQRAYELNRGREGRPRDHAKAEALLGALPQEGPPFALCRRANGLAYARWKQGDAVGAAAFAREACRHAGDGGHVRMRAMALAMLARIVGGEEGACASERAIAIAK